METNKINVFNLNTLRNTPKYRIPELFISNLMEGNKDVVKYLPEINLIDTKIGKLCQDVFEKMGK